MNFLTYNIIGGNSALYGEETASFYLRNGITMHNLVFIACLFGIVVRIH